MVESDHNNYTYSLVCSLGRVESAMEKMIMRISDSVQKKMLVTAVILAAIIGYGVGKYPKFLSISSIWNGRIAIDVDGPAGGTYSILECADLKTKEWRPALVALEPDGVATTNLTFHVTNTAVRIYIVPPTNRAFYGVDRSVP